jgi:phage-related protein
LPFRGDAYRVIYTAQFRDQLWVVHVFQKKSKQGIKTPHAEMDVVRERIKRLVEQLG